MNWGLFSILIYLDPLLLFIVEYISFIFCVNFVCVVLLLAPGGQDLWEYGIDMSCKETIKGILKLIDWILLILFGDALALEDPQFAYQHGSSTTMCTWAPCEAPCAQLA